MPTPLNLLLLEDRPEDAQLILNELRKAGFTPDARRVETEADFLAALNPALDVILTDYSLPQWDGIEALRAVKRSGLDVPVIIVSGSIGEEMAVAAMREGAADYLLKDRLTRLGNAVTHALSERQLIRQRREAESALAESERFNRSVLDALTANIAVLDAEGNILATNRAWREFAEANGGGNPALGTGANYLEVCERAAATGSADSARLLEGIRAVTRGAAAAWTFEYPCHSPTEQRWFYCSLQRFPGDGPVRVVVAHENITAMKLAQSAQHESAERLRLAVQAANVGLWDWDIPTGRVVYSREWKRQLGYEDHEIGNGLEEWKSRVHPDDLPGALAKLEGYLAQPAGTHEVEVRMRNKDGNWHWIHAQGEVMRDAQGTPVRMMGCHLDITARKQAEEVLRDSEARFLRQRNTLISLTAPHGPDETGLLGRVRQITEASGRTLGVARVSLWQFNPEHTILRCLDLYELAASRHTAGMELSARDYPAYFQALKTMEVVAVVDASQDARTSEFTNSYLRPLGITSMMDATVHVLGRVDGVLCHEHIGPDPRTWQADEEAFAAAAATHVSLAIEEHHRQAVEDSLRHSEERYRQFFEANPMIMWLQDEDSHRVLAVNESAVSQYGYSREECLGMTAEQFHHAEDVEQFRAFLAKQTPGLPQNAALRHRRKDGSVFHVELVARSLVFAGRPSRLVLASDVTEKKQVQEKFLHAQRLESLGMLAAGIAHDLNNVLSPIMFAAPLLRESLTSPRDRRVLDTLMQCATRGAGLVKQILGFAGATTGEFQVLQVKHIARDIIGVIEETFPKSIRLESHIPSDLWPIRGDATQIHQVLLNLCVNARDAMPQGGTLRLVAANRLLEALEAAAIPGARAGAWLILEVGDTGTGISPELMTHIWEPFFTTKGPGRGTGLGLPTVRGIVASHLGFLTIDTQVGRGTTFRVYLPTTENEVNRPTTTAPFSLPRGQGQLILVVDDDEAMRYITAEILNVNGYRVITAVDGAEAISVFNLHPGQIALVITDIDMPNLGGVALVRAMQQIRPDLPLLAMSGLTWDRDEDADVNVIQKLAGGFLLKPFKEEALLSAVHQLLAPANPKAVLPSATGPTPSP